MQNREELNKTSNIRVEKQRVVRGEKISFSDREEE
jgi:hypothetical protein